MNLQSPRFIFLAIQCTIFSFSFLSSPMYTHKQTQPSSCVFWSRFESSLFGYYALCSPRPNSLPMNSIYIWKKRKIKGLALVLKMLTNSHKLNTEQAWKTRAPWIINHEITSNDSINTANIRRLQGLIAGRLTSW